jgi:hypothetical protein
MTRAVDVPRADGWARASVMLLAASALWTALVFIWAAIAEPCDEFGQCVLALNALFLWIYTQALAVVPTLLAIVILTRDFARGHRTLPTLGFWIFTGHVGLSALFLWYLTTIPFGFR